MNFTLRLEQAGDEEEIAAVIADTFADHPHSDGREPEIVDALRKAGALSVSLVAQDNAGVIVGHIAISPIEIEPARAGWYGLGPVAVLPPKHGNGIGSALITAALAELRGLRAAGCTVLGEPGFYNRFGFAPHPGLTFEGVPAEYFMALPIAGRVPQGLVRYHVAFDAPDTSR